MLSSYGRVAKGPVRRALPSGHGISARHLAQVANIKVEPFLLEDMAEYKAGNEEQLAPFVISRRRGFLPRKVRVMVGR